ncbi:MAG: hypothetical protein ACJATA_001745 [Sphingobacteriales bacterium]|jgi:hypothetical protein
MSKKNSAKTSNETKSSNNQFLFNKDNYKLMIIGVAIMILGYLLMIGDENIYDFRKTTLAPMVILAGIIFEIYAIMKPTKSNSDNPEA